MPRPMYIRMEIRQWRLDKENVKGRTISSNLFTLSGVIFNDEEKIFPDGKFAVFENVSVSEYRGQYLFGRFHGGDRYYIKGYKISRDEVS